MNILAISGRSSPRTQYLRNQGLWSWHTASLSFLEQSKFWLWGLLLGSCWPVIMQRHPSYASATFRPINAHTECCTRVFFLISLKNEPNKVMPPCASKVVWIWGFLHLRGLHISQRTYICILDWNGLLIASNKCNRWTLLVMTSNKSGFRSVILLPCTRKYSKIRPNKLQEMNTLLLHLNHWKRSSTGWGTVGQAGVTTSRGVVQNV